MKYVKKIIVVSVAALGYQFFEKKRKAHFWSKLHIKPLKTVFPALTCPVQASFRTGSEPQEHGIVANGFFDCEIRKTFFWEQASTLYSGERIWNDLRKNGGTVGQLCWQNSIGNDSDMILSPAPVHKHHGGMIQEFYSRPANLYRTICKKTGSDFSLFNYWGPFASLKSSEWICNAALEIIRSKECPDLFLIYLPHLDYSLQKFGDDSSEATNSFTELEKLLEKLFVISKINGFEFFIFGDYAINSAENVIYPNRILLENNLLLVRNVRKMLYPDLWSSKVFALADHQIAHIYIREKSDIKNVTDIFARTLGIKKIHFNENGFHKRSGNLILEASPGFWFSYQWWTKKYEAPDYASHVDIHNKPGYDPCELFISFWPPFTTALDQTLVKGTHGSSEGLNNQIVWATSIPMEEEFSTLTSASQLIKKIIN